MLLELVVLRAVQDVNRMRQQVGNGFQRLDCAAGASWQINDQRLAAGCGDAATQRGCGNPCYPFAPHFLSDAGNDAIGYSLRGFGSVVSRADAGPTGGGDQVDASGVCQLTDIFANCGGIVGNAKAGGDFPA